MEAVYGDERARMEWGVGLQDLRIALADLPPGQEWRGAMAPDLSAHVDEDGSAVAYELGALFLYQLEQKYGRAALDAFLAKWFEEHAFTSVTTPQFVRELLDGLIARDPSKIDPGFLHRWIDEPGVPADAMLVPSDAFARVDAQRQRWESGELPTAALETSRWTVQEWLQFLNGVARPHAVAKLVELDRRFALTGTRNAEIAHAWYRLALASGYPGLQPVLERYLTAIGRVRLIRPLYMDLMKTPEGADFARRVYAAARPGYHAIAQRAVDRVVK
jgi:hypothetical protein